MVCERRAARVSRGWGGDSSDTNAIPSPLSHVPLWPVSNAYTSYFVGLDMFLQTCHRVAGGIIVASEWFCHGLSGQVASPGGEPKQPNHTCTDRPRGT